MSECALEGNSGELSKYQDSATHLFLRTRKSLSDARRADMASAQFGSGQGEVGAHPGCRVFTGDSGSTTESIP